MEAVASGINVQGRFAGDALDDDASTDSINNDDHDNDLELHVDC